MSESQSPRVVAVRDLSEAELAEKDITADLAAYVDADTGQVVDAPSLACLTHPEPEAEAEIEPW